ncbi:hypothetical protein ACVWZ6_002593 [Bradyrhizobium sp. GM6.1]
MGIEEILQKKGKFREIIQYRDAGCQPSIVIPFLTTMTPRSFTLASNEITFPSFHISSVTVSPGRPALKSAPRAA